MRKVYRGEGIEVSFDLDRCIHIGECLLTLPEVFDLQRRPWIEADGADPDVVADTVLRCPSGALMFRRLDGGPEEAHATTTVHSPLPWRPRVMQMSALKRDGLDAFWKDVGEFRALQTAQGRLAQRRSEQDRAWMWERISAGLQQRFRSHPAVRAALRRASEDVRAGRTAPSVAARQLLALLDAPSIPRGED